MADPIDITKRVDQGNVLSPLLSINIFISDLGDDILETEASELYDSKISYLLVICCFYQRLQLNNMPHK